MNKRILILLLAALSAFGLSACAMVGPDYRRPALNLPSGWSRAGVTDGEAAGTRQADLSEWWKSFNDPLLSSLVNEALKESLDVKSAQARLREARAQRAISKSGLFPIVSFSGSASRTQSDMEDGRTAQGLYSAGFDASWELDIFGGVRRGIEASEADLQSTAASLQDTLVSLAAEVARDYVELRSLQQRVDIARRNLDSQSETLQLTEWRAQAGLVSNQDVLQAQSSYEQTRAQIPSLERSIAEAEHALDILLAYAPGTLHSRLAAAGGLPSVPDKIAVGIPADTLRQRPDVIAAERKLAAETARVGVAEAARYPSFKLSGSIGLEALTMAAASNGVSSASSLLASITAPIFNAGKLKNQVKAQDAVREQAEAAYKKVVLGALRDVENALAGIAYNRDKAEALTAALGSSKDAAELARQRYSAGLIDFQSVLDTQRNVLTVEDNLASARADGVQAVVSLYKALGGGWSPQEKTLSSGKEMP